MKLLRTIRLDPSDTFVFERAAEPGEWALVGSFAFWGEDIGALAGKRRAAFRAGFLGVESLGHATLAVVAEASEAERDAAVRRLAEQLVARFGAPDSATAWPAAQEEIALSASLADHPPGTLVAMHRTAQGEGVREQFRTLRRRADGEGGADPRHLRAFSFFEAEEDGVAEEVDLVALAREGGSSR